MYAILFFVGIMVIGGILGKIFNGDDDQTQYGDIGSTDGFDGE